MDAHRIWRSLWSAAIPAAFARLHDSSRDASHCISIAQFSSPILLLAIGPIQPSPLGPRPSHLQPPPPTLPPIIVHPCHPWLTLSASSAHFPATAKGAVFKSEICNLQFAIRPGPAGRRLPTGRDLAACGRASSLAKPLECGDSRRFCLVRDCIAAIGVRLLLPARGRIGRLSLSNAMFSALPSVAEDRQSVAFPAAFAWLASLLTQASGGCSPAEMIEGGTSLSPTPFIISQERVVAASTDKVP